MYGNSKEMPKIFVKSNGDAQKILVRFDPCVKNNNSTAVIRINCCTRTPALTYRYLVGKPSCSLFRVWFSWVNRESMNFDDKDDNDFVQKFDNVFNDIRGEHDYFLKCVFFCLMRRVVFEYIEKTRIALESIC